MAYFLLTAGEHTAIVSGKCITCARNIAAAAAGPEGPQVWRIAEVQVLRDTDQPGFIFKGVIDDNS